MKFRKLFVVFLTIAMISFGVNAMAGWGIPIGKADIDISADNSDQSGKLDGSFYPMTGLAVGGGSISGYVDGEAKGLIINGTVSADAPLPTNFGGGNSESGKTDDLGTWTRNLAATGAQLDLAASTPSWGLGGVAGYAYGQAEQHSLNTGGGIIWNGFLNPGGVTAGIATQQSSGGFDGKAVVGVLFGCEGEAGFDASIVQNGWSMTNSFTLSGNGKGLGTEVGASTIVTTSGGSYDNGLGYASLDGGFSASGNVATLTSQNANGGNASAAANGSYSGAASLGKTYNGNANGYSQTFAGDNGVMYSGAGMSVTSTITHTPAP